MCVSGGRTSTVSSAAPSACCSAPSASAAPLNPHRDPSSAPSKRPLCETLTLTTFPPAAASRARALHAAAGAKPASACKLVRTTGRRDATSAINSSAVCAVTRGTSAACSTADGKLHVRCGGGGGARCPLLAVALAPCSSCSTTPAHAATSAAVASMLPSCSARRSAASAPPLQSASRQRQCAAPPAAACAPRPR
jgi:hypothetical protein